MNKFMKVKLGFAVACCAMALAGSAAVTNQVSTVEGLWVALTNSTCDVVALANGEYKLASQLTLNRAVTVLGGGYSDCTLLQTNKGCRVVLMSHEDARLEGVTVTGGTLGSHANGCGISMSAGTVVRCRITGNYHTSNNTRGRGIYASGGTILQCVIDGNGCYYGSVYAGEGGGLYLAGATTVDSCLVAGNIADCGWWPEHGLGGGIYVGADGCSILNSTIVGNRATHNSGGLHSTTYALTVKNCIIAGNTCRLEDTNTGYPNWYVGNISSWEKKVSNCFWASEGLSQCVGAGSMTGDPMFTDAENGDYTLADYSPAIGLGAYYDGIPDDLVGRPRRNPPDVGCYQSVHPLPLECAVTFGPERALVGTTFALTSAVENARSGMTYDYYWTLTDLEGVSRRFTDKDPVVADLAPGDYEVTLAVSNRSVVLDHASATATNRLLVCALTNYVTSVAGAKPARPYARPGTAATSIHDAMAVSYPGSVIILDAGTHAIDSTITLATNVTIRGAGREATILKGHGKSGSTYRHFTLNSPLATVRDMTLTGGYMYEPCSCVYIGSQGGRLINCALIGNVLNTSNRTGGPLVMESVDALADRCVIACNTNTAAAYDWGSTKDIVLITKGTLRNSIIRKNVIIQHPTCKNANSGHIVELQDKSSCMENCTIVENTDNGGNGCALYLKGSYQNQPRVYNVVLAGNTTPIVTIPEDSRLPNLRTSSADYCFDVRNCCYVGSAAFGTDSFVATDAKFVDAANGDYRLRPDSPCRNKGLAREWAAEALDVYGQPRICSKSVDIGAAECPPQGLTIIFR